MTQEKGCDWCKHMEYDFDDADETPTCLKRHELLLSLCIPDDCKDFEAA